MAKKSLQIKAEIKALRDEYEAIIARNDPSDDVELSQQNDNIAALVAQYSDAAQSEAKADSNRQAMAQIFASDSPAAQPTGDGGPKVSASEIKTFSEMVLGNPQFKAWLSEMTAGGTRAVSNNVPIKSPTVELPGLSMQAALLTGLSSTSGGALVVNDRTSILVPAVRSQLRAVDLLTRQTTTSDTVEYVRVGTETNAAVPVLEATTVSDGAKPESSTALSVITAIVETIAHWIPVTRRAMSDAGQLASYLDDFLRWGLLDQLNDQVINGTGSTPQLMGIDDLSGKQAQAWSTNFLTTTRKARTLVRIGTGGATPTAYLLNPTDWETADLLQDNEARYFFGGPAQMGTPMLWGLPVVEDEDVTAGLGFVGDWKLGIIWDRQQTNVLMTDSHSDFFVRNILVLLAEMRAAIGWLRPAAFVEMDLTA